ncbi:FRG domain-containing protein [Thioclava sp. GXIMD4215]|uniref:FRG domain-containing protein n=1 Tax=Thioclava sp. GXIMD4215 TaxID=3131928 RepID=UPI00324C0AD2
MKTIGKSEIKWCPQDVGAACTTSNSNVRKSSAIKVANYLELANRIAEIQYFNPEHAMVFRGQGSDHRDHSSRTTIMPTIFRNDVRGRRPQSHDLINRFESLKRAENNLLHVWRTAPIASNDNIKRYRILRWSILQHYEICATPLLDVTYSLRVAASFASLSEGTEGFVYVLGVPNITGTITSSLETGLQVIRLSSVCPPQARRPHIQEGYLLGSYPELSTFDEKQNYRLEEVDFGRRLIAKFCFDKATFWQRDEFPAITTEALYPDGHDEFAATAQTLSR